MFAHLRRFPGHHRPACRELSNYLDMDDDLLTEPLESRDGQMRVNDRPGLGIEVDPKKIQRYRIDR